MVEKHDVTNRKIDEKRYRNTGFNKWNVCDSNIRYKIILKMQMIEIYKLLHNKCDGDVSSIVKLRKNYVPREGTRGMA